MRQPSYILLKLQNTIFGPFKVLSLISIFNHLLAVAALITFIHENRKMQVVLA
jgi:hypothetical protein